VITISPPAGQVIQANVVILHGWGGTVQDAAYFASLLRLPHVQLILPEGSFQHPYSDIGRMWYGLPEPVNEFQFQMDLSADPDLQISRTKLLELITNLPAQTGVPLAKTIVGGFSQGGAMAIDIGLGLPLAGLMVLSGYLHKSLADAPRFLAPILQVHGTIDPVVPLIAAQQTRDALRQTGAEVQYEEIPGMGHEISLAVLDRMQRFILDQVS
jgi:phospholipase/carboxylesterase